MYAQPLHGQRREGAFLRMKTAVFLYGGYLRVLARQVGRVYDPDFIEAVAHRCISEDEFLLRILYYDCAPYRGNPRLPVSGKRADFKGSDEWLKALATRPLFAVRLGVLKFRGFEPRATPIASRALTDDDFRPRFEQKGVDVRLGLDIAAYAADRTLDRIVLISGDTDCLPAMKLARIAGLQVILAQFPGQHLARELLWHSDFHRLVEWPNER